ncbi:MAG: hypothetical protein ACHQ6T_08195 [Myxococcota bacterium]
MTRELLADYGGDFEPDFAFDRLSAPALARLGRELMLFAHFHDRGLMPLVAARFGREHMTGLACDEWMGASPLYNARARALLAIPGDGVSAILKSLQVDPGFAHRYMDVRYELVDESLGFFALAFCGAYQDVHKISRGSELAIIQLCHHMEDPTFDATAIAVNPRARVRPEHRPPLALGHAGPTCRWRVYLDGDAQPYPPLAVRDEVAASRAARFRFADLPAELGPGLPDYSGPFVADFQLEQLARPVLARLCREWTLDVHLLTRAAAASLRARWGAAAARELAREQWAALAPVYVPRLQRALGILGDGLAPVLKMLQVDPALPHEYVRRGAALESATVGHFWIEECEAFAEGEPEGWLALLLERERPGIDAVAAAVNPRARCVAVDPASLHAPGRKPLLAWRVEIDPNAAARAEAPMANAVRVSNVARFELEK